VKSNCANVSFERARFRITKLKYVIRIIGLGGDGVARHAHEHQR